MHLYLLHPFGAHLDEYIWPTRNESNHHYALCQCIKSRGVHLSSITTYKTLVLYFVREYNNIYKEDKDLAGLAIIMKYGSVRYWVVLCFNTVKGGLLLPLLAHSICRLLLFLLYCSCSQSRRIDSIRFDSNEQIG